MPNNGGLAADWLEFQRPKPSPAPKIRGGNGIASAASTVRRKGQRQQLDTGRVWGLMQLMQLQLTDSDPKGQQHSVLTSPLILTSGRWYVWEIEVPAVFGTEAEQSAQRSGEQQADGKRKSAVEIWARGEVVAGVGIVGRRAREGHLFQGSCRSDLHMYWYFCVGQDLDVTPGSQYGKSGGSVVDPQHCLHRLVPGCSACTTHPRIDRSCLQNCVCKERDGALDGASDVKPIKNHDLTEAHSAAFGKFWT